MSIETAEEQAAMERVGALVAAVLAELRAKYALLAAELVLVKPEATIAATIDKMCRERDQVARRCAPDQPACLGTIAYQRCVAGLVWFTSTQPPKPEGQP
jgi:hypothetical protein